MSKEESGNKKGQNEDLMVSIVVCARNEERTIRQCMESLVSQTYKNREIIVVDDESTDRTPEIVKEYDIEYHRIEHQEGIAAAIPRKYGLDVAKGDIIFLPDADEIFSEDWVEKCVAHFRDKEVAGCTAPRHMWRIKKNLTDRLIALRYRWYWSNEKSVRKRINRGLIGAFIIRKSAMEEIGGIDGTVYGEDSDWTRRLLKNNRIAYEPTIESKHNWPDTFGRAVKHAYKKGKLSISKFKKYKGLTFRLIALKVTFFLLLPVLIAMMFFFSKNWKLAIPFTPWSVNVFLLVGVILILPYLKKMIQLLIHIKGFKDFIAVLYYPIYSYAINYANIFGLIRGSLKKNQDG